MTDLIKSNQQQKPVETLFAFSIGPAVDLAKLDDACREILRQPWPAASEGERSVGTNKIRNAPPFI